MPYDPPPELAGLSLTEIAGLIAARKLPPVADWAPAEVGESHMVIAADGRWYHDGGEITRPAMVRAFSTLLQRDAAGLHWLVTPLQRLCIEVVDAAFIAVKSYDTAWATQRQRASSSRGQRSRSAHRDSHSMQGDRRGRLASRDVSSSMQARISGHGGQARRKAWSSSSWASQAGS